MGGIFKRAVEAAPLSPTRFMASKRYRWAVVVAVVFFFSLALRYHDSLRQATPLPLQAAIDNVIDNHAKPDDDSSVNPTVDWSRFAYTQYVTNSDYLCNSIMFFEALHRLSSRADRVIMFPSSMLPSEDAKSRDARLLIKARDEYNVKLVPITLQHRDNADCKLRRSLVPDKLALVMMLTSISSDVGGFVHEAPRVQSDSVRPGDLD
jgi:hypothetical protein